MAVDAPPPISRRSFLTRIGAVGGAAALYGTMDALGLVASPANAQPVDFVPPGRGDLQRGGGRRRTVVIIGAGIAGLTTAYELAKAGYDCRILEARDRPGGRAWTVRGGTMETDTDGRSQTARFASGQYLNAGPARIPDHHVTLDYCRELGVAIEAFTNANANAYYFNESTGATDFGALASIKVRQRTAKADYFGYVSELLGKAVNQGALDAELTEADKQRVVEFANSFGGLSGGSYTGGPRRGYVERPSVTAGVVDGPPPAISTVLASRHGGNFSFELSWDQAMMMWQPVGGMDRIPVALAGAVGRGRITYQAEVLEITNTGGGVAVTYADRSPTPKTLQADYVVCTIPPQILKRIPNNFSAEVTQALDVPAGAATGKIGLQYSRRWWEEDERIFGGITQTNMDVSTIWYPSYGYLGQGGVVVGYYNFGGNAVAYGDLAHAAREARAVAQGEKIHGSVYRSALQSSFSVAWQKTRFSEGGWVSWPGGRGAAYERLLQPDGNVYFAGDHLSYYTSWQAGAFESARKVVMDLHQRVMAA